jgi:Endosomal/lysosomal potassium channel TMEM175
MYPRARLDALTDGVFAVAMTLLVLDVRLPENFEPQNATELIEALRGLVPKFVPYVISFIVLGLRRSMNFVTTPPHGAPRSDPPMQEPTHYERKAGFTL